MSTEQVKPGYKRTEVGVIPEDWAFGKLGDLCYTSSGTTPSRSLADRYFRGGTVNWVKTLDLNNSLIDTTDEQVTNEALSETSLRVYPPKTVLIAMYGGFNQIGRTGILEIPACVNQAITAVQCGSCLDARYLLSLLNFKVEYWKSVASSSRKDPNITSQDIRDFAFAFPDIKEQTNIADALSDVDALLAQLDHLIAKKRDLKQAAMQQLLTGQSRLPGFSGEWEVNRLGDVADMGSGGTPLSSVAAYYDGNIPWVSISDMTKGGKVIERTDRNLTELGFTNSAAQIFPAGTILYAMYASLGECSIAGIPLCTSQAILGIRPREKLHGEFLFYYLTSLKATVKTLGQQGTQANLNKGMVQNFRLSLPTVEEQTAISTVLSDMDAELTALDARRDKTRALKQGMIQELLTGRIRLV